MWAWIEKKAHISNYLQLIDLSLSLFSIAVLTEDVAELVERQSKVKRSTGS